MMFHREHYESVAYPSGKRRAQQVLSDDSEDMTSQGFIELQLFLRIALPRTGVASILRVIAYERT
jgi:hypothetical protein